MEERIKWACFHVPANEEGEKEMEYLDYIDNPSPNIKEFYLPEKQNDLIFRLYLDFDDEFNILIDNCESERMKKEDVPKALEMALAFKEKQTDEAAKEACDKIIEVLTFAKEHNSMVEFWF